MWNALEKLQKKPTPQEVKSLVLEKTKEFLALIKQNRSNEEQLRSVLGEADAFYTHFFSSDQGAIYYAQFDDCLHDLVFDGATLNDHPNGFKEYGETLDDVVERMEELLKASENQIHGK